MQTPTDHQVSFTVKAARESRSQQIFDNNFAMAMAVIQQWEKIRPDENAQLQRMNHALAEELEAAKAELRGALDELATQRDKAVRLGVMLNLREEQIKAAKEALTEWIPVSEIAQEGRVVAMEFDGSIWNTVGAEARSGSRFYYYIPHAALANLPKREPAAPKPDPQAEFKSWWNTADLGARCSAALIGWKAVVAKKGGSPV